MLSRRAFGFNSLYFPAGVEQLLRGMSPDELIGRDGRVIWERDRTALPDPGFLVREIRPANGVPGKEEVNPSSFPFQKAWYSKFFSVCCPAVSWLTTMLMSCWSRSVSQPFVLALGTFLEVLLLLVCLSSMGCTSNEVDGTIALHVTTFIRSLSKIFFS